jgi:NAD-dependent dihydropyrimidine dehydrogenase PreA subunit
MKIKRKIIEIDEDLCDGCGQCVPSCAEGAIQIIDGKARLITDIYCDGLGACLGECPTGALKIVEREAEDFDEEAVERHLSSMAAREKSQKIGAAGCPGSQIQIFGPSESCEETNTPSTQENGSSELSHWPIQIRLVPPTASFLKGADLLVVADCVPVAYPKFHRDFLTGKAMLMGCPKFDNAQEYVEKFADIFRTADIKSITIPIMEVPCCRGLPAIIEKGMDLAGKNIPVEKVVIGKQGEII